MLGLHLLVFASYSLYGRCGGGGGEFSKGRLRYATAVQGITIHHPSAYTDGPAPSLIMGKRKDAVNEQSC